MIQPPNRPDPNDRILISRRRFLVAAGLTGVATWLSARPVFAEKENMIEAARKRAETTPVTVQSLRGNITALLGSGGNIAVLIGPDGKFIVDSGYATSRNKITDALNGLSRDPIKHLVNTHWHFDHTDGNEWMHSDGATILAHENTLKHLSTSTRVADWDFTFEPLTASARPTEILTSDKTLHLNGTDIILAYYGPSHTDGDLSAYFVDADVLHAGDTWWNGRFPFIDYSTGGNINGMIKAAEANVNRATDKTIGIPGHGPIAGKKEMIEYRDMLVTIRDRVAELKKSGKSLDEAVATKPTAAYDAKWAGSFVNGDVFTRLVFTGV